MSKFIVIKKAKKGASSGSPSVTISFDVDNSVLSTLVNEPSGYKLVLFLGTGEVLPALFTEVGTILDPETDFIVTTDFDYDTSNGELGTKNWLYAHLRTSGDVTIAVSNTISTTVFP